MAFVSITRLRIRSLQYAVPFAVDTLRTLAQNRRAEGFLTGSLLADRRFTFWTMTVWRDRADMKRFMTRGAHWKAMPKLLGWCDEASVVNWTQDDARPPDWSEADRRMRDRGRPSKVRHPSGDHADLTYARPRLARAFAIRAKRSR